LSGDVFASDGQRIAVESVFSVMGFGDRTTPGRMKRFDKTYPVRYAAGLEKPNATGQEPFRTRNELSVAPDTLGHEGQM